jgi:hypothetical protein
VGLAQSGARSIKVITKVVRLGCINVETAANAGFLRTAQSAASSLGVTLTAASVHNATDIETAVMALSAEVNCGLMVMPHPVTVTNRELILKRGCPGLC